MPVDHTEELNRPGVGNVNKIDIQQQRKLPQNDKRQTTPRNTIRYSFPLPSSPICHMPLYHQHQYQENNPTKVTSILHVRYLTQTESGLNVRRKQAHAREERGREILDF
jgi:hypothetical protein